MTDKGSPNIKKLIYRRTPYMVQKNENLSKHVVFDWIRMRVMWYHQGIVQMFGQESRVFAPITTQSSPSLKSPEGGQKDPSKPFKHPIL